MRTKSKVNTQKPSQPIQTQVLNVTPTVCPVRQRIVAVLREIEREEAATPRPTAAEKLEMRFGCHWKCLVWHSGRGCELHRDYN